MWDRVSGFAQNTGLAAYGEGGCGSDFVPTFHTGGEMPVLGNAAFRLVSENLTGAAPGFVFLSARKSVGGAYGDGQHYVRVRPRTLPLEAFCDGVVLELNADLISDVELVFKAFGDGVHTLTAGEIPGVDKTLQTCYSHLPSL